MEEFKQALENYLDKKIKEAGCLIVNNIDPEAKRKYEAVMRAFMKVKNFVENYENNY